MFEIFNMIDVSKGDDNPGSSNLPKGFFEDPEKDAKARGKE